MKSEAACTLLYEKKKDYDHRFYAIKIFSCNQKWNSNKLKKRTNTKVFVSVYAFV